MERTRFCARPGCGHQAVATLSYEYANRTARLDEPGEEPNPAAAWGLCSTHASRLSVPVGWALQDQRTPVIPIRPQIAV